MPQDWEAGRRCAWYRSRCVVEETHFPPSLDMKRKRSERGTRPHWSEAEGWRNLPEASRGSGEIPLHWDVGQGSRDRSLTSEVWPGGGLGDHPSQPHPKAWTLRLLSFAHPWPEPARPSLPGTPHHRHLCWRSWGRQCRPSRTAVKPKCKHLL